MLHWGNFCITRTLSMQGIPCIFRFFLKLFEMKNSQDTTPNHGYKYSSMRIKYKSLFRPFLLYSHRNNRLICALALYVLLQNFLSRALRSALRILGTIFRFPNWKLQHFQYMRRNFNISYRCITFIVGLELYGPLCFFSIEENSRK